MALLTLPTLLVGDARALTREYLRDLPERWNHSVAVARRAEELAGTVNPAEVEILVAAAWLHDIGYAPRARDTGFHPVDGARLVASLGWSDRIIGLIAHHSGAAFVAQVNGQHDALAQFHREESAVADALTYADQTVGPLGQRMSVGARLAEARRRHGPRSAQGEVRVAREAHLRSVAHRVEERLRA